MSKMKVLAFYVAGIPSFLGSNLRPIPVESHSYKRISGYTRTLPTPQIADGHIYYSESILKSIHEMIPPNSLKSKALVKEFYYEALFVRLKRFEFSDKEAQIGDFVLAEFFLPKSPKNITSAL